MSNVAAVVLAAGMSQRMGRLKPLLPFGDKPMIARVVQTLQSAGDIHPIVVVTGNAAAQIEAALAEYSLHFTHNEHFAAGGMLSSVKTGVAALPPHIDAFFLVLGDQPAVRSSTLIALRRNLATKARAGCLTDTRRAARTIRFCSTAVVPGKSLRCHMMRP
jgi:CTP:molybdopterin cytidylyltransferase MocA